MKHLCAGGSLAGSAKMFHVEHYRPNAGRPSLCSTWNNLSTHPFAFSRSWGVCALVWSAPPEAWTSPLPLSNCSTWNAYDVMEKAVGANFMFHLEHRLATPRTGFSP